LESPDNRPFWCSYYHTVQRDAQQAVADSRSDWGTLLPVEFEEEARNAAKKYLEMPFGMDILGKAIG
jgi:hypothetical protein